MNEDSPTRSRLSAQLSELATSLADRGIRYVLIGGIAVNVYGFVRSTLDIDVLLNSDDAEAAKKLCESLGYRVLDFRDGLASYVRGYDRVDVLHANLPTSRNLIAQPNMVDFDGKQLPFVSVEGLLGLKAQAYNDDPRRSKDVIDMIELFRVNFGQLNLEEIRAYFELSDQQKLFDDLVRIASGNVERGD